MPGTRRSSAPVIARAVARPPETWTILSCSPWTTVVGTRTSASRPVRFGWVMIARICRAEPLKLTPRSHVSPARRRAASSVVG
jgi:hypothetical protein